MIFYAAIYRLALGAYALAIRIAALFNPKAKLFVEGRENGLAIIRRALSADTRTRIWMHCASLGEFEQGRPVIEAIREQYPQIAIVITFFSPSGYEVRKDYKGADYVFYLPLDNNHNAIEFLDIVKPSLCVFVKYEFWYYYLKNIASRKIPAILVSAIFTEDQGFFRWYGSLLRNMLRCFTHIFVQDADSATLLKTINITNVSVSGDTRFDRVKKAVEQADALPIAVEFSKGNKILVAGSTWAEDEKFLQKTLSLLPKEWKLILVPHEVSEGHISEIEGLFEGETVRWTKWPGKTEARMLLVDRVGLLTQLYGYGRFAWIGGGFGKEGVHNVLEAAVYGIPCFYGPVFHQFLEAKELVAKGAAFTVNDPAAFVAAMSDLDGDKYVWVGNAGREYVNSGAGATDKVMTFITENILLSKKTSGSELSKF